MNSESQKPPFKQKIVTDRTWASDENAYLLPADDTQNLGLTTTDGTPINPQTAAYYGISKHMAAHAPGFGTKFHDVYRDSPDIYYEFSVAENSNDTLVEEIYSLTKAHGSRDLLDVACGTGVLLGKLHEKKAFEGLSGIDISIPLLDKARTHLPSSIHLLSSAAERLPFLDNEFDACVTTWGSYSPNEALREMERVTRPGGIIIRVGTAGIDDLTRLFKNYSEEDVEANKLFLERHGFKTKEIVISISFANLERARTVLTTITGCDQNEVTSSQINHRALLSWKQKPAAN